MEGGQEASGWEGQGGPAVVLLSGGGEVQVPRTCHGEGSRSLWPQCSDGKGGLGAKPGSVEGRTGCPLGPCAESLPRECVGWSGGQGRRQLLKGLACPGLWPWEPVGTGGGTGPSRPLTGW